MHGCGRREACCNTGCFTSGATVAAGSTRGDILVNTDETSADLPANRRNARNHVASHRTTRMYTVRDIDRERRHHLPQSAMDTTADANPCNGCVAQANHFQHYTHLSQAKRTYGYTRVQQAPDDEIIRRWHHMCIRHGIVNLRPQHELHRGKDAQARHATIGP